MTVFSAEAHPAVIEDMARTLVGRFAPKALILFGSQARGDADEFSDVDFVAVVDTDRPTDDVQRDMLDALARFGLPAHVFVRTPDEYLRQSRIPGAMVYPAEREGRILHEWPGWRESRSAGHDLALERTRILADEYAARAEFYLAEAARRLEDGAWLACRDRCRYAAVKALQGLHVLHGAHPPRDIDVAFQFSAARAVEPGAAPWRETALDLAQARPESRDEAAGLLERATDMVRSLLNLYGLEG